MRGALIAALAAAASAAGQDAVAKLEAWRFDRLRLTNGSALTGLLVGEQDGGVRFRHVVRKPGRPTVSVTFVVPRAEVAGVDPLSKKDRAELRRRLEALDAGGPDPARLELTRDTAGRHAYASDRFRLTADAPEAVARRAAVRLEEIFAAFAQFLPPRRESAGRTDILLYASLAAYRKAARADGVRLLNPAYYDARADRVVGHAELGDLGEKADALRARHQKMWAALNRKEAELRRLFGKGRDLERLLRPIRDERVKLTAAERHNRRTLDKAYRRLFARLRHEAFHAYLARFVYPDGVPGWLNEGLAQVFETALVEAGELRLGHADPARLKKSQGLLRRGELLPSAELLRPGGATFHIAPGGRAASERAYLTAWALAMYVTFEARLLGTDRLDRYVADTAAGRDPVKAFARLVGEPIPEFEPRFHEYLRRLR